MQDKVRGQQETMTKIKRRTKHPNIGIRDPYMKWNLVTTFS